MSAARHHLDIRATNWKVAPAKPVLKPGAIHLWRVPLGVSEAAYSAQLEILSEEEHARYNRFHYPEDRRQNALARVRLRQLIGRYLELDPTNLAIKKMPLGKPYLAFPTPFRFNLSQVKDWALIAFTLDQEIGVDIEPINTQIEVNQIVSRFFSCQEVPTILAQPGTQGHQAFFRAWTRKEAIIKAIGDGLSLPLDQFGVSILDEDPVQVLHTDWAPEEYRKWYLASFTVASDIPGAVAVKGNIGELQFLDYP